MWSQSILSSKKPSSWLRCVVVLPSASGNPTRSREPYSKFLLDGFGFFQSSICSLRSRLPKLSLPTSPTTLEATFSPTPEKVGRSHWNYLHIFGVHFGKVPTRSLQKHIPTTNGLLILVVGSKLHNEDPLALFTYGGFPWLAIHLNACQRNMRTLGWTFSRHIFLHKGRSVLVVECSVCVFAFILRATR